MNKFTNEQQLLDWDSIIREMNYIEVLLEELGKTVGEFDPNLIKSVVEKAKAMETNAYRLYAEKQYSKNNNKEDENE